MKSLGATAVALCAMLCACASKESAPLDVHTVKVPIPIRCEVDVGPAPLWPDSDDALRAAPDLFHRVQLLVAGRLLRMAREQELTVALEGCSGPVKAPGR
jgi:hypothetical protein